MTGCFQCNPPGSARLRSDFTNKVQHQSGLAAARRRSQSEWQSRRFTSGLDWLDPAETNEGLKVGQCLVQALVEETSTGPANELTELTLASCTFITSD